MSSNNNRKRKLMTSATSNSKQQSLFQSFSKSSTLPSSSENELNSDSSQSPNNENKRVIQKKRKKTNISEDENSQKEFVSYTQLGGFSGSGKSKPFGNSIFSSSSLITSSSSKISDHQTNSTQPSTSPHIPLPTSVDLITPSSPSPPSSSPSTESITIPSTSSSTVVTSTTRISSFRNRFSTPTTSSLQSNPSSNIPLEVIDLSEFKPTSANKSLLSLAYSSSSNPISPTPQTPTTHTPTTSTLPSLPPPSLPSIKQSKNKELLGGTISLSSSASRSSLTGIPGLSISSITSKTTKVSGSIIAGGKGESPRSITNSSFSNSSYQYQNNPNQVRSNPIKSEQSSIWNQKKVQPGTRKKGIDVSGDDMEYIKGLSLEQLGNKFHLTKQQSEALHLAITGRSFFLTGSAGTGKSYLVDLIVKIMSRLYPESVYVTAASGIAACNIGGTTVHSFAGIGTGEGKKGELLSRVYKSRAAVKRWQSAQVLIIDEISMISLELFENLEYVARIVRNEPNSPFGNIQLLVFGDFFQLPPVSGEFCFLSSKWNSCLSKVIVLDQVFRQTDQSFVQLLNELRFGRLTDQTRKILQDHVSSLSTSSTSIQPTLLYSHRKSCDMENLSQLEKLPGEEFVYSAKDSGQEPYVSQIKNHCAASSVLKLKLGAQVMLLKNLSIEQDLVNGSRGVVIAFSDDEDEKMPVVRFASGHSMVIGREEFRVEEAGVQRAMRSQVPLSLAWAISIHKSQGLTIQHVAIELSKVFEYGQAYVALSRATCLEGLQLLNFKPEVIRAHPQVVEYYNNLSSRLPPRIPTPASPPNPTLITTPNKTPNPTIIPAPSSISTPTRTLMTTNVSNPTPTLNSPSKNLPTSFTPASLLLSSQRVTQMD